MNRKQIKIIAEQVERQFLPFVRKPGRYIGGEINQPKKNISSADLAVALCFPDIYEVGMSNSGIAIIYDILNAIDWITAERVFSPWHDAEEIMREKNIPLFTLESKADLKTMDIIGFSVTNELCYTNILNAIDLAGIKVRSSQRTEEDPIIIAGGGMANCCEPIADFIDLFILGEAEDAIVDLANLVRKAKQNSISKKDLLLQTARKFNWAYVPSLYEFEYENEKIKSIKPLAPDLPTRFENAVVEDFENAPVPLKPLVPFTQAIHERLSVEIMRGCPGRCRFCQASFCRRPIRFRSIDKILEIAKAGQKSTGYETVSLLSLSTADYPDLEKLTSKLHNYFNEKHVGLSLPSLKVDQQLNLLPALVTSVRKGGLTIAVEAASSKVRQIINKPLKNEDLFAAVESAYQAGWQRLKLYFMVGLPGETEEDIKQIADLSCQLAKIRKKVDDKTGQINAAVSWLVPKPHTPLSWMGQKPKSYFQNAKQIIIARKNQLRAKFLNFKFHEIECSVLESAVGRGDRRLCNVIEQAWKNGATFDLWRESFDLKKWEDAFEKFGLDIDKEAQKSFQIDETLPWQHLGGPKKDYLLTHLNQALKVTNEIKDRS